MIVNNVEVAYITFDATSSNKIDWFNMSRVLDSSYTDHSTADDRYFTVDGYMFMKIDLFGNVFYQSLSSLPSWRFMSIETHLETQHE